MNDINPDHIDDMPPTHKEGGIINWFAQNHVAANILMALFIVAGLVSVSQMRTETFPSVDPRTIAVTVNYSGATPYEIADSITSRIEEAIVGTEGVKRTTGSASEGVGRVYVELEDFANADDVYNDVETAVNGLADFPPEDAERAEVVKSKPTPSVMNLALYGDMDILALRHWAEIIEEELRQLPNVALVSLSGIPSYEISIEVPANILRHYNISLQDIGTAIEASSIDIPAGTIESNQGDILLRVQDKRQSGQAFESIALRTLENGRTLYLGDIAHITDGIADTQISSRYNGKPAAFIGVNRSESQDTLEVAASVKDYLQTLRLPKGLQLEIRSDETESLNDRINLMMRNAILGFMLVFVVLLLFLDLKLAFWTSVAIPVSFLGGLTVVYFLGYSINMVSLFALIVVLGIVVDDAIVTGESIFDAQEKYSKNSNAVMHGLRRIISPVTIGVSTTIAAFAPLMFSTGTLGQIISVIPIVVIPVLAISLLEAFLILPSHLEKPNRWSLGIVADIRDQVSKYLHLYIEKIMVPVARFAFSWRYVTFAGFIAFGIITISMVSSGTVRFIFFPQIEGDEVSISLEMPIGTPYGFTESTMAKIEDAIDEVEADTRNADNESAVQSISVTIGQTASNHMGPGMADTLSSSSHLGQVRIQLVASDFRDYSAPQIERMIREKISDLPGIENLSFQSVLIGGEADIDLELTHSDDDVLLEAVDALKEQISTLNGTYEITDSFTPGKLEYVASLTPEGLAVGLTPSILGQHLRYTFFGLEVQRVQRGREEILTYVRLPKNEREDLDTLYNSRIMLDDGRQVPLRSVALLTPQTGYSTIQTVDGNRIVNVTAKVDYAVTTPGDAIEVLQSRILPELKDRYSGLSYSFEGESRNQAEDMASLGQNMLLALLLIYVLLGAQLRSYIQPVVIMSAIPFGVFGAIWGHFLLGHDLSFISMFGIVALAGVVVNDSVVMVDYFNIQRANGQNIFDSCILAIERRFRPILLTTLTTCLGLLPMLLETSIQARFLIPMVISLATGLLFATCVILIMVPCLLLILDDIKSLPHKIKNMTQARFNTNG